MNEIRFGDCREIMRQFLSEGKKAQMCVTSPPYFGLRDYGTANWSGGDESCDHSQFLGGHGGASKKQVTSAGTQMYWYRGQCKKCGAVRTDEQIGLEESPDEYIANMVEVFRGVKDLLADDGVLWLNIGDSYANVGKSGCSTSGKHAKSLHGNTGVGRQAKDYGDLKPKDLIGIPWSLAFALRADGWYLRQDIIWHKPNAMPRPDKDRCVTAHEYIFLLSKSAKYYFDYKAIQEPAANAGVIVKLGKKSFAKGQAAGAGIAPSGNGCNDTYVVPEFRNKRSVWTVTTKPYKGTHFATFPADLIEPCVRAGSRPNDVILDPFMGSGTTAQVAVQLDRQYLGCELNEDYKALQDERISTALFGDDR